jgi:hypothetical protein
VKDDLLEPDAALFPELRVLRVVPGEVLHYLQATTTCAQKAHIGIGPSVPKSVPKRSPTTITRQPTPTKSSTKNGPEIIVEEIANDPPSEPPECGIVQQIVQ